MAARNTSVRWIRGGTTELLLILHDTQLTEQYMVWLRMALDYSKTYRRRRVLLGARREELDHKRAHTLLDEMAELGPLQIRHGLSAYATRVSPACARFYCPQ